MILLSSAIAVTAWVVLIRGFIWLALLSDGPADPPPPPAPRPSHVRLVRRPYDWQQEP